MELTLFQALYGVPFPIHIPYLEGDSLIAAIGQLLKEREDMWKVLQYQLSRAQSRMKSQADKHRSKRAFQIGDMVFLKLQRYKQTLVSGMPNPKLAPKFYGSFKVVDVVGKVAYKLELPASAQIHDVFHVSQFKKAYGYNGQFIPLPIQGVQIQNFNL